MSNNREIRIKTTNIVFGNPKSILETETSKYNFVVTCNNTQSSPSSIECDDIPDQYNHISASIFKELIYPYADFNLAGYNANFYVEIVPQEIKLTDSGLPVPPEPDLKPEYSDLIPEEEKNNKPSEIEHKIKLDDTAIWRLIKQDATFQETLNSPPIRKERKVDLEFYGPSCKQIDFEDTVYILEVPYTGNSEFEVFSYERKLSHFNSTKIARNVLPSSYDIDTSNQMIRFSVSSKLKLRYLMSKPTMKDIRCPGTLQDPFPISGWTQSGESRYITFAMKDERKNVFDKFFIETDLWKKIANYPNEKIYAELVLKDGCFNYWMLTPVGWLCLPIPCLPLLLPLWINVGAFNFALKILAMIIKVVTDFYFARLEFYRNLILHQNAQELVMLGQKAVGATKALVNGDLNDELIAVGENLIRITKELVDTTKDYEKQKELIEKVEKLLLKITDVVIQITEFINPASVIKKVKVGSLELMQKTYNEFKSIIVSILSVIKDAIKIIQELPDNIVTRHIKKIANTIDDLIKTIIKFANDVKNYGEYLLQQVDLQSIPSKILELDLINKISNLADKVIKFMEKFLLDSINKIGEINIDLSVLDKMIQELGDAIQKGELDISIVIDNFKDVLTTFVTEETLNELKSAITPEGVNETVIKNIIFSKALRPIIGEPITGYLEDFTNDGTIADDRLFYILDTALGNYVTQEVMSHVKILVKEYLLYKTINPISFSYLLHFYLDPYVSIDLIGHIERLVLEQKVLIGLLAFDVLRPVLKNTDFTNRSLFIKNTDNIATAVQTFDPDPKLQRIFELLDARNAQKEFLNTLLEDTGAKQLALTALEKGESQKKSDLEKQIGDTAFELANTDNQYSRAAIKALKIRELEELAFKHIYKIREILDDLLDMLQNFFGAGAEREKNRVIAEIIKQESKFDIYQISRFGRFDPKNPDKTQIIINDINGVKILNHTGHELWSNNKLCNLPFLEGEKINNYGCGTDNTKGIETDSSDACSASWHCEQKEFWLAIPGIGDILKARISFDFMKHHDLALGGIRIGDFDGDGIDDIWCYEPKTTKGLGNKTHPETNHKIVFSPLDKYFNHTLPQTKWCLDGNVFIGDFNGDKKADSLCITNTGGNFYLLYGDIASFTSASEAEDGKLDFSTTPSWSALDKIIVADIDGDNFSDLLNIRSTSVDILFGHKDNYFILRPDVTTKYNQNQASNDIATCYQAGINKIIVGDFNNDGKDDIRCINGNSYVSLNTPTFSNSSILSAIDLEVVSGNSPVNDGYESAISAATASGLTNPKKNAIIVIDDLKLAQLSSIDLSKSFDKKQKRIDNTHPGGQSLISYFETDASIRTISDISYSFDCFNAVDYNLDVSISVNTLFEIPEYLISPDSNSLGVHQIEAEVTAQWKNNKLINFYSNPLSSFANFIESANGLSYNVSITRAINTINVPYSAKAKIYIEEGSRLLSGQELKDHVKTFLGASEVGNDESSVSMTISGSLTINMLALVHNEIIEGV
jgi:hypothetical protein